ncbi:hypothetical protein [Streptomyces sp. ST2-7A]|uniref:hypothetical protein n=1 Tax=Streptomyces sp. ST2-7A TaxID=2907214 RepID=UPI001F2E1B24|nr:hypothetical protein [Streptomyces sp. ST2-7A]MCE7081178.1 hypothetical protein [Streptomyces sp. ST2-7A]
MSYDISLHAYVSTGGPEPKEVCVAEVGDYTANVAPMWDKALGHPLRDLTKRRAGDALDVLRKGIAAMETDPDTYREMSPQSGWGSYEGALKYLRDLRDACALHPNAQIYVLA